MLSVLADSGPLAALYNRRDHHHASAVEFFRAHGAQLRCHTTWEVISEVMYFLDFSASAQGDFLDWLHHGHERGLMLIAAGLSVYGTHVINSLRTEAFAARQLNQLLNRLSNRRQ